MNREFAFSDRPGRFDITQLGPILDALHTRLAGVIVDCLPYALADGRSQNAPGLCEVCSASIARYDRPRTLFYLDPPYLHATRASTDAYAFEMTETDHRAMLATIKQCEGKVMLSGYPNDLYDRELAGWNREDIEIDNKAAGGKEKRKMTEVIWLNY